MEIVIGTTIMLVGILVYATMVYFAAKWLIRRAKRKKALGRQRGFDVVPPS